MPEAGNCCMNDQPWNLKPSVGTWLSTHRFVETIADHLQGPPSARVVHRYNPSCEERKAYARAVYGRKLSQIPLAPCAHVAVVTSNVGPMELGGILFEHHAVLDVQAAEVIHYSRRAQDSCHEVIVDKLSDFEALFPNWRIVRIPTSTEDGQQILERARSHVGEKQYSLISNNCEHFATSCFEGRATSLQVWSAVGNIGSSVKTGITSGLVAAAATTQVTTPYYFLGFIPWGTTTTTVPLMGKVAATSLGVGAGIIAMGVGFGGSYGVHKWVDYSNEKVAQCTPIAVRNLADTEIYVRLANIDSSSWLYSPSVDDFVHDMRAYCGVGRKHLVMGSGLGGELNPAAEEDLFSRFMVHVSERQSQPSLSSQILQGFCCQPLYKEVACCEAKRGDVFTYKEGELTHVPDRIAPSHNVMKFL